MPADFMTDSASFAGASLLHQLPLLHDLPEERRREFLQAARRKSFPKGTRLYTREDEAGMLYVIESGWVKLFRETLDGDEAITDILTRRHIFGETALFHNGRHHESAEAVEDTVLYAIPLPLVRDALHSDGGFALALLHDMARRQQRQHMEIEHLIVQSAPQRIGCFLLRLCNATDTSAVLHLPYDKMVLATRLGMQPETFSRALGKLRHATGMEIRGATVSVPDTGRLAAYCCNACSDSYPCGH